MYHTSRVSICRLHEQAQLSKDARKNGVPIFENWAINNITPLRREIYNKQKMHGNAEVTDAERERIAKIYT